MRFQIGNHEEEGFQKIIDLGSWRDSVIGNYTHFVILYIGVIQDAQISHNAVIGWVPAREWWKELRVLWKLVRLVLKALPTDAAESEGPAAEVH
uniref:Uncharacterized protein n=1 Tax=Physcomitrium patens TaxID=3218 RepID=A0A2K1IBR2_PHYPA|nr:hypothetical protein PHYPA_030204 [Physcomitrium patens]